MQLINLHDYEKEARKKLLPAAFDYYVGGALDEKTIAENTTGFDRIKLCNRALSGVLAPDTQTTLLGHSLSMPVIIAPTAFHGMAHAEGEVATARAAAEVGTIMVLSTTSNRSIADVCAAAGGQAWFQLYMFKDSGINTELIARAENAGCKAIVLTVDVPAWGRRERDMRNRFGLPHGLKIESLLIPERPDFYDGTFQADLGSFINARFKFDLSWQDVDWLLKATRIPVLLKGIMHPHDAQTAVSAGTAGIVVSNHGGRQLDSAPATIDVLPRIMELVGDSVPVIVDGGIRRGTDVLKALALGARAVGIGRPILWGLAAKGQQGVLEVLELFRAEIRNAMSLCGCDGIANISEQLLWPPSR